MGKLLAKILCSVLMAYGGYAAVEWFLPGMGGIGIVFTSNFWGRLFARDLINFFSWIKYQAKKSAVFHWHGSYYSFDGRQIRFFLIEGTVWIPLRDLQRLLEPDVSERELRLLGAAYAVIPDQKMKGVTEDGLLQLLRSRTESRHTSYKMVRLKKWLLTNALPNVKRLPKSAINNI
ncbi:hypothetical protein [Undibacterium sp. Di24W]|uniref:hypothetical protein n=1 Tax=Undibacterium sp. Di24W TaxID=3413033 RepID=UPI003BF0328B